MTWMVCFQDRTPQRDLVGVKRGGLVCPGSGGLWRNRETSWNMSRPRQGEVPVCDVRWFWGSRAKILCACSSWESVKKDKQRRTAGSQKPVPERVTEGKDPKQRQHGTADRDSWIPGLKSWKRTIPGRPGGCCAEKGESATRTKHAKISNSSDRI